MHVVLVEPEIPQNTGSVGRLCAGSDTPLHLVGRLGFSLDDRYLKRAGLDYWPHIRLTVHRDWAAFVAARAAGPAAGGTMYFFSARGGARSPRYCDVAYAMDDALVFGGETRGLPRELLAEVPEERVVHIPHSANIRSHNLANAVSIALYEGLRQRGFPSCGAE